MLIVIQARSTSTRLIDKARKDLCGKMLIERCYEACAASGSPVILAIPFGDEMIKAKCITEDWMYREGPELDVLTRYVSVARTYQDVTHFARITGDCSLISSSELMFMGHIAEKFDIDFFSNCIVDPREGMEIEILSRRALEWLNDVARINGYREHVTTYIKDHTDQFVDQGMTLKYHREPYLSDWIPSKLSIDTQEDLNFIKGVWAKWILASVQ